MSLYRKSRSLLFEEFLRRSYQGVDDNRRRHLFSLKIEDIDQYKKERDTYLKLIHSLSILLRPSKSVSLKESLCRICEALDVDYYVLYLLNKKKTFLEKKIHYSKTPQFRDVIMKQDSPIPLEQWVEQQQQPLHKQKSLFHLSPSPFIPSAGAPEEQEETEEDQQHVYEQKSDLRTNKKHPHRWNRMEKSNERRGYGGDSFLFSALHVVFFRNLLRCYMSAGGIFWVDERRIVVI